MLSPDFFSDPKMIRCSFAARILFQGMWCLSDRAGVLEGDPLALKMKLLPGDNCDVPALVKELEAVGVIVPFVVEARDFIFVKSFTKRQHVHPKEPASSLPPPPTGKKPGKPWKKPARQSESESESGSSNTETESKTETETESGDADSSFGPVGRGQYDQIWTALVREFRRHDLSLEELEGSKDKISSRIKTLWQQLPTEERCASSMPHVVTAALNKFPKMKDARKSYLGYLQRLLKAPESRIAILDELERLRTEAIFNALRDDALSRDELVVRISGSDVAIIRIIDSLVSDGTCVEGPNGRLLLAASSAA